MELKKEQLVYYKGDSERGAEIIKALKDMGGINKHNYDGTDAVRYYFINPKNMLIDYTYIDDVGLCNKELPFLKEFYEEKNICTEINK